MPGLEGAGHTRAHEPTCERTGAERSMRAGHGASGPRPKAAHESAKRDQEAELSPEVHDCLTNLDTIGRD
jgi:hypothetical protein